MTARPDVVDVGCRSMAHAAQGFPVEHQAAKATPLGAVAPLPGGAPLPFPLQPMCPAVAAVDQLTTTPFSAWPLGCPGHGTSWPGPRRRATSISGRCRARLEAPPPDNGW